MPSPFPGMDPFIECQEWEDFHTRFNTVIADSLSPDLEPRYVVRVERRVYVEFPHNHAENFSHFRRSDVAILAGDLTVRSRRQSPRATTIEPVEREILVPEERRETRLVIRERKTAEVVTILESLSPANKRRGGDGRQEYISKRLQVISSEAHLVELDLLRGGDRLPMATPLPPGDYYAIVSRANLRPRAQVYAWTLRQPLPNIPIPLKAGDADVMLELQKVFTTVYDRARYDLTIDYDAPLSPPLSKSEAAWLKRLRAKPARRRSS